MKNLKTILAALLVMVLVASCKKHETKPLVAYGQVAFEVIETDSLNKDIVKTIKYGYDNVIKEVTVTGNFTIVMDIPASNDLNDKRNIFLICESSESDNFTLNFNQVVEGMNNMLNFKCFSAGTCAKKHRELTLTTLISQESYK